MKILIIEDSVLLADTIAEALQNENYAVDIANDGQLGYEHASTGIYDMVILDLMLPKMNGYEVLSALRRDGDNVPVLILSAKTEIDDKIQGFTTGADDYMTKPFSLSVLLLKIEAHFRRRKNEPGTPKIHSKDIVFIPGEMRAFVKEREISLTKNELKMLSFFLQNPKQILSKTQILENVFDLEGDFVDENTIAVNIRRLREKIEDNPAAPVYIKNIRGLGYIWNQEVSQ